MRVLAVTADASLQVALASMMPDWELRALTDASDAVDAGDAAVALVDLGSTARGLDAARALTFGLQIPCVVIGEEDVDDEYARIVVRPFTLSELGDAVHRAAAEGVRVSLDGAGSADEVPAPAADEDPVAEEELEELSGEPTDIESLLDGSSADAEQDLSIPTTQSEGPAAVEDAVAEDLVEEHPVREEPVVEVEPEVVQALEAEVEQILASVALPDPDEDVTRDEPAEEGLAPVVPISEARAQQAEAPSEAFREAFEALADIAAIPIDGAEPEPEPEPEPVAEEEVTPLDEPETAALDELLDELGQRDGKPPFGDGGSPPPADPQPADPPPAPTPSKTVEYVRSLLAELDMGAEPEPALAGAHAGARVVRERAPRPVIRQNIVPEPTPPTRRGLRRRKAAAAVKQQPVQAQPQQGILGRLSVALWAARDLEALLLEMPVLGEPRTVAHAFLGQVVEMFGPETAAVYTAKPDDSWSVLAPHGLSSHEASMHVAPDQPLFAEVAGGGNGVFIAPVDLAQGLVAGIGGARTETLMAVPLEAGGRCVAVAIVGGAAFSETDLGRLCGLAVEAAPGLAFALLMERLRARL